MFVNGQMNTQFIPIAVLGFRMFYGQSSFRRSLSYIEFYFSFKTNYYRLGSFIAGLFLSLSPALAVCALNVRCHSLALFRFCISLFSTLHLFLVCDFFSRLRLWIELVFDSIDFIFIAFSLPPLPMPGLTNKFVDSFECGVSLVSLL